MLIREFYNLTIIKDIDEKVPTPRQENEIILKNCLRANLQFGNFLIEKVEWKQTEGVLPLAEDDEI